MGLYLFFLHLTIFLAVSEFAPLCSPLQLADDIIAVNCGSSGNSTALDGRQWTGDVASRYIILQGSRGRRNLVSSTPVGKHLIPPTHPVPYMTAQISRSTFIYTFHVTPGQKFIRLHFYPTEYPGFERSKAFFTVKAGPYALLRNFSAALTADVLALPSFAKEFCVHVEDSQPLTLTFSPSSEEAYAFVNGIEIVSIPTGLYHSREGDDPGVHVVGKKFRYPIFLDTSFALETVHRLNVGGSSILPIEDTGMFREWFEDSNYFLESRAMPVTTTIRINYAVIPTYSAPTRVYQTSRSMTRDVQAKERISFTWKLPVDQGFRYLLRFHFCELEYENKEVGQMEFSIFIENQIAEANADLIKWAGGNGIAVYRDYMVMMEGDRTEGKRDMTVTLIPHKSHDDKGNMEHSSDAILKGLEVFKLSNPDNNLAGVNMVPIAHASTSHNSKPQKLVLGCGIYTIANILISVLIILDVVVYPLAYLGQKSRQEDTLSSFPSEGPYLRFSLAELQLATRNFDNGLVIGSGGFGNVYKGLINGGTTTVAIKRMKPKSRQGPNEFWMEIETISKFRHKHLVSLLGYCDECDEKILVYEYMEQGTLAKHLYKKNTEENGNVCHMPWEQRLKICIGAARGLDYLHTGIQGGVIHRDVKTTNILLNKDMVAKVSDFGLCKMGTTSHSVSHVSTNVKGTFGYFDPHYFSTRILTKKSDVYAFGVVLLEVLCGRPAVDLSLEDEQHSLSLWAQGSIKDGKLDEIIDPILRDELPIPSKSLEVFAEVARKCLHTHPNGRSTMADVVVSLESALAYLQDDRCKDSSTTQGNEDVVNVDAADEDKENVLNLGGAEETKNDEIIQLDDDAVLAEVPSPSTAVQYAENIPLGKKGAQGRFTKVFHKISTAFLPRTVDFGWINRKANYYGSSSRHSLLRSDSNSGQLSHKTTFWHHTGSCGTDKRTISAGNRKSMSTTSGKEPYPDGQVLRIPNIRAFSLSELRNATRNFRGDRCIGEGGFGKVYKGWLAEKTALQNGSSSVIAVKEWNSNGLQGFEEWQCEINILSRLSHPNIIKLLGYCRESERLFLVFEFMQKGSLENHLFGRGPSFHLLPWETRLKILRGAIRGLAFLHSLEPQIIFRDFKSSNILLDASYNARITDFGLAKLGPATTEESHVTTRVMGTYGYAAPEYIATGQLYVASDVYAVGVVMVEMLTGLRALDTRRDAGQHDLVEWCRPFLATRRKFERIMDSCWKGKYPAKVAWQIGQLSLKCLQLEPKRRPSMQQVVEILESFENPKESS